MGGGTIMAIECPIQKRNVLYLDCNECENVLECQQLRLSNFQIKENTKRIQMKQRNVKHKQVWILILAIQKVIHKRIQSAYQKIKEKLGPVCNVLKLNINKKQMISASFIFLFMFLMMCTSLIQKQTTNHQVMVKTIDDDLSSLTVGATKQQFHFTTAPAKIESSPIAISAEAPGVYMGSFYEILKTNGIRLQQVENPSSILSGYEGNLYILDTKTQLSSMFDTMIQVQNYTLDAKNQATFDVLASDKNFTLSTDLSGNTYTRKDVAGNIDFMTRGVSSINLQTGKQFYAAYLGMYHYENCKPLGIHFLNGLDIDTKITDVFRLLGTPTSIDAYEPTNGTPYLLLHYTNTDTSTGFVNELSFVFVEEKDAINSYYLRELTISITH